MSPLNLTGQPKIIQSPRALICTLLVIISSICSGQDLTVNYDFISKKIEFQQKTKSGLKTVTRPYYKKGSSIVVNIINFNPFALNLELNSKDSVACEGNLSGLTADNMLGGAFSQLIPGGVGSGRGEHSKNGFSKEFLDFEKIIELKRSALLRPIAAINKVGQFYQTLIRIRKNVKLTEKQLKDSATALGSRLFETSVLNETTFANYSQKNGIDTFNAAVLNYRAYAEKFLEVANELLKVDSIVFADSTGRAGLSTDNKLAAFYRNDKSLEVINALKYKIQKAASEKNQVMAFSGSNNPDSMGVIYSNIEQVYNQILTTDFTKKISIKPVSDIDYKVITLNFYSYDFLADSNIALISSEQISLQVPHRVRFAASSGFTFAGTFRRIQDYGNNKGVIVQSSGNNFIPAVVAFATVYFTSTNICAGGISFGVGIPLVGQSSATFYLGPSLLLGKKQQLLITAGISGGQVVRLANGAHVGDTLGSVDAAVPIHTTYEPGYFLGISYNIMAGFQK
jgi:hypothetical protein